MKLKRKGEGEAWAERNGEKKQKETERKSGGRGSVVAVAGRGWRF
jgi:hypothetical protein